MAKKSKQSPAVRSGTSKLTQELKAAELHWSEEKSKARVAKSAAKEAKKAVKRLRKLLREAKEKALASSKKAAARKQSGASPAKGARDRTSAENVRIAGTPEKRKPAAKKKRVIPPAQPNSGQEEVTNPSASQTAEENSDQPTSS